MNQIQQNQNAILLRDRKQYLRTNMFGCEFDTKTTESSVPGALLMMNIEITYLQERTYAVAYAGINVRTTESDCVCMRACVEI